MSKTKSGGVPNETIIAAFTKHYADGYAPRKVKRTLFQLLCHLLITEPTLSTLAEEIFEVQKLYDFFDYLEYGEVV
jgi:hypothetical protein